MGTVSHGCWQSWCTLWVLCLACVAARSLLGQPAVDYKRYWEHDSYGNDLPDGTFPNVSSESECQAKCSNNVKCTGYVWAYKLPESSTWYNYCWLKQGQMNPRALSTGASWAETGLMVGVKVVDTVESAASKTAPTATDYIISPSTILVTGVGPDDALARLRAAAARAQALRACAANSTCQRAEVFAPDNSGPATPVPSPSPAPAPQTVYVPAPTPSPSPALVRAPELKPAQVPAPLPATAPVPSPARRSAPGHVPAPAGATAPGDTKAQLSIGAWIGIGASCLVAISALVTITYNVWKWVNKHRLLAAKSGRQINPTGVHCGRDDRSSKPFMV